MELPLQRLSSNLVVPDTNILIYSVKQHIDLKWELSRRIGKFRMVMLSCVKQELEGLSRSMQEASVALTLYGDIEAVKVEGSGDTCIVNQCVRLSGILITNDRNLAKTVKNKGLPVLNIRDGRSLEWYR